MPIHSGNPLAKGQQLYGRMVELITDVPLGDGRFRPQLNFTAS
jgi:hypothetical protein